MLALIKRDENAELPVSKEVLIMFYHEEFVKALKQFGYMKSPPSLLDLNIELLKNGAMSAIMDIAFMQFTLLDWSTITAEDMMTSDKDRAMEMRKQMYSHPTCQKIIKQGLRTWIAKGIL